MCCLHPPWPETAFRKQHSTASTHPIKTGKQAGLGTAWFYRLGFQSIAWAMRRKTWRIEEGGSQDEAVLQANKKKFDWTRTFPSSLCGPMSLLPKNHKHIRPSVTYLCHDTVWEAPASVVPPLTIRAGGICRSEAVHSGYWHVWKNSAMFFWARPRRR